MSEQKQPTRDNIKSWVEQHIKALEARDISAFMADIHADIKVVWPRAEWTGASQFQAHLEKHITGIQSLRFYLRRLLIDVQQSVAALEWVCRYVAQDTKICYEFLGGAALDFTDDGQLYRCQFHLDFDRSGLVSALELPWPHEQWSPCQNPGPPPDRAQSEQLLQAYTRAWSSSDVETVGQLLHDNVYLCPPWNYQEGKEAVVAVAHYHFTHFLDTQVTPHRIIFDESQPYFGVCQQTFACTNPKTNQRGEDSDFVFFEICEGKLRYWRNYFDTGHSIQDEYKNRLQTMQSGITTKTSRQFIDHISAQHHAMAGAVISVSAAQAVALGEACIRISLEHQPDTLDTNDVSNRAEQMADIKNRLAQWCNKDATAIAEFVALREVGEELKGQQLLCQAPAEISQLSIQAATILQDFRPLVSERVHDDLEMSITLLAGTAQAAMLLLDSNLRIWPEKALLNEYEPIRADLEQQIGQLTPTARIRND